MAKDKVPTTKDLSIQPVTFGDHDDESAVPPAASEQPLDNPSARIDVALGCFDFPVEAEKLYFLQGLLHDTLDSINPKAAIAKLEFRDADGAVISGPYAGCIQSQKFGDCFYLASVGAETSEPLQQGNVFIAPQAASSLQVSLYPYKGSVALSLGGALTLQAKGQDTLAILAAAVVPELSYELHTAIIDTPDALSERAVVAKVEFFDASGNSIAGPYKGCSSSKLFAQFLYLGSISTPDNPLATTILEAPANAAHLRVVLYPWKTSDAAWLCGTPELQPQAPLGINLKEWAVVGENSWSTEFELPPTATGLLLIEGTLSALENKAKFSLSVDFLAADGTPLAPVDGIGVRHGWRLNLPWVTVGSSAKCFGRYAFLPGGAARARVVVASESKVVGFIRRDLAIRFCASAVSEIPGRALLLVERNGRLERKAHVLPQWGYRIALAGLRTFSYMEVAPEIEIFFADAKGNTLAPGKTNANSAAGGLRFSGKSVFVQMAAFAAPAEGFQRLNAELAVTPPADAQQIIVRVDNRANSSELLLGLAENGFDGIVEATITKDLLANLPAIEKISPLSVTDAVRVLLRKYPDDQAVLSFAIDHLRRVGSIDELETVASRVAALPVKGPLRLKALYQLAHVTETRSDWLPHLPALATKYVPLERSKPRVAHLFKTTMPYENTGGAIRCNNIVKFQKREGWDPIVVTPLGYPACGPRGRIWEEELYDGIKHFRINPLGPQELKTVAVTLQLEFGAQLASQILRQEGVGLIQASSGYRGYELALQGLALSRQLDVPFVYEVRSYHEHTWRPIADWVMDAELTRARMGQEERCMREADAVVTICETMREGLVARGMPREKIFVVPNSVDLEHFTPQEPDLHLRASLGLGARIVVGYVSNLSKREGHRVLIEAVSRARAQGAEIDCLIVGDGTERSALAKFAQSLGIGANVVFTGEVPHEDIARYYNLMDVFVVPRIEDFASDFVTPMKPFEAMALRRAVIVSDRPALHEVVEPDVRGLSFVAGDAEDLAMKIVQMAESPELRNRLAEEGRRWVEAERTWAKTILVYDDVYRYATECNAKRKLAAKG